MCPWEEMIRQDVKAQFQIKLKYLKKFSEWQEIIFLTTFSRFSWSTFMNVAFSGLYFFRCIGTVALFQVCIFLGVLEQLRFFRFRWFLSANPICFQSLDLSLCKSPCVYFCIVLSVVSKCMLCILVYYLCIVLVLSVVFLCHLCILYIVYCIHCTCVIRCILW